MSIIAKNVQFGRPCLLSAGQFACVCSLLQLIVDNVRNENVLVPIQKVLAERQKMNRGYQKVPIICRSIYREILFLVFAGLGKDEIDVGKY